MSLLLSRLLRPSLSSSSVRSSLRLVLSNGFASYKQQLQYPPCYILCGSLYGEDLETLVICKANEIKCTDLEKKVPRELVDEDSIITVGASHGWVATMKEEGILRLQDDLNPFASDSDPKRIPLPPLVTLPGCQTKIVTNVSMSSSSPEDEDCVVAVKFLGPQLSFCKPAQSNPKWTNLNIKSHTFYSSRVMFSKKDDMFCLLGSGGQLILSWDLHQLKDKRHKPKMRRLRYQNLPELSNSKCELLHACHTTEHLVESRPTGETFVVNWLRNWKATASGTVKMKTRAVMVYKLDKQGNAVYTRDIGDLNIFISKSEPFCVLAGSFPGPGMFPNCVEVLDVDEYGCVDLDCDGSLSPIGPYSAYNMTCAAPYHIPPQNIL